MEQTQPTGKTVHQGDKQASQECKNIWHVSGSTKDRSTTAMLEQNQKELIVCLHKLPSMKITHAQCSQLVHSKGSLPCKRRAVNKQPGTKQPNVTVELFQQQMEKPPRKYVNYSYDPAEIVVIELYLGHSLTVSDFICVNSNVHKSGVNDSMSKPSINFAENKRTRQLQEPAAHPEKVDSTTLENKSHRKRQKRVTRISRDTHSQNKLLIDTSAAPTYGGTSDSQITPSRLNVESDKALSRAGTCCSHNTVRRNKVSQNVTTYTCEIGETRKTRNLSKGSSHQSKENVTSSTKDSHKTDVCMEGKTQSHFRASKQKCSVVHGTQSHMLNISMHTSDKNMENSEGVLCTNPRKNVHLQNIDMKRSLCPSDRKKQVATYPGKRPCTCVMPHTSKEDQDSDVKTLEDHCTNKHVTKDVEAMSQLSYATEFQKCKSNPKRLCRDQKGSTGGKRAHGNELHVGKVRYKNTQVPERKKSLCNFKEKYLKRKSESSVSCRLTSVSWVPAKCSKCRKTFSVLVNKTTYKHRGKTSKVQASGRQRNEICNECKRMIRAKRTSRGRETYSCAECGKKFIQQTLFILHQKSHVEEKLVVCPVCGKRFVQHSLLVMHQKTHKNKKPFQCMVCGNSFYSKSLFVMHQRTHKEDKPHHCSDCGKSFADNTTLLIHQRIHTGEKPFSCKDCGKRFSQHSTLVSHQRIHTGEKPYECRDCGKRFSDRSACASHRRTHTGEKPFKCEACGKRFAQSSNLRRHERLHTGQKPHVCSKCGKAFNENTKLKSHENVHLKREGKGCWK